MDNENIMLAMEEKVIAELKRCGGEAIWSHLDIQVSDKEGMFLSTPCWTFYMHLKRKGVISSAKYSNVITLIKG